MPLSRRRFARHEGGFTLIELMVTVAVVGILASVAYPSYMQHVQRSKVTDITRELSQYQVRLEQYFQDNRVYGTGSNATCPSTAPTNDYATITCITPTTTTFTVTAASKAGQGLGAAGDFTYTLNETGAQTTTKLKGTAQTGKNCWLIKGDEC